MNIIQLTSTTPNPSLKGSDLCILTPRSSCFVLDYPYLDYPYLFEFYFPSENRDKILRFNLPHPFLFFSESELLAKSHFIFHLYLLQSSIYIWRLSNHSIIAKSKSQTSHCNISK